ncbi:hypothetical protein NW752_008538 [Fusarium irregulare]|uniref:Uncharacterized protein n=1 Tax=Fusarium irregulare TaxID=2494466 RepID=A0A9W8UEB2_9HYPO|nr:hypothetical protein NW752_008538 [Fusarium irregulare]KAJ4020466.1 hypothetical protein NW766_001953 [Fusarium irregulare]
MESQESSRKTEFLQRLDWFLASHPDADARLRLRQVFDSAYSQVEGESVEAEARRAEAEEAIQSHQRQLNELEAERKALRDEKAKLKALTESIPSEMTGLASQVSNLSGEVRTTHSAVADVLQATNDAASASKTSQETAHAEVIDKLKESSAAEQIIVDAVDEIKGNTKKTWTATEAMIGDHQVTYDLLEKIQNGVDSSLKQATLETCVQPLVGQLTAIGESVNALPSASDIGGECSDRLSNIVQPLVGQIAAIGDTVTALPSVSDIGGACSDRLSNIVQPLVGQMAAIGESVTALPSAHDIGREYNSELSDHYTRRLMELQGQCHVRKQRADRLQEEKQQLMAELNDLRATTDQELNEANEARAELQGARDSIDFLNGRVERRDARILELQESEHQLNVGWRQTAQELEQTQLRLQQAETSRQDLENVTTQLNSLQETIDGLRAELAQSKTGHQEVSGRLAEVQMVLNGSVAEKQVLENEHRNTLEELNQLRSQKDQERHTQLENKWDMEKKELLAQLADTRSRETEALKSQLKESWEAEKQGLHAQLADKSSLVESRKHETEALRMVLERTKHDQEALATELGSIKPQLKDKTTLVAKLEAQLSSATEKLKAQEALYEAHPILSLRADEIGDLAKVYLEVADECYDLKARLTNTQASHSMQAAGNILPYLARPEGMEILENFINSRATDWHCLSLVMGGELLPMKDGGPCTLHRGCTTIRVTNEDSPVLEIFKDTYSS